MRCDKYEMYHEQSQTFRVHVRNTTYELRFTYELRTTIYVKLTTRSRKLNTSPNKLQHITLLAREPRVAQESRRFR